jgi:hypothetical protein
MIWSAPCSRSRPGVQALLPMPTPRKALQCVWHEGVFTMTLTHGADRLESARLVRRRVAPDDLPFFTRIHALPEVAQHLYPGGRPRSPEETAAWLRYTLGAMSSSCSAISRSCARKTER